MLIKWWLRLFLKLKRGKAALICGRAYKSKKIGEYTYYIKEEVCQRLK